MKSYGRELFIKILLILVSEGIVVIATEMISKHIVKVPYTPLSSILCGALLAVVTVTMYDRWVKRRKELIRQELKNITDAALMRYDIVHIEEHKDVK